MTAPRGVTYPYICSRCGEVRAPDNGKDEPGRMAGYAVGRFEVVCEACVTDAIGEPDREALDRRLAELGGAW